MHDLFPDWMRTINPDQDISSMPLEQWWGAIEGFLDGASPERVLDICRAAFNQSSTRFDNEWRQQLRDSDPLSPMRQGNRQIAVLAGAALIQATEYGPHQDLARYSRRCSSHLGWQPALADAQQTATELESAATADRSMPSWPDPRKVSVTTRNLAHHYPGDEVVVTGPHLKTLTEALASNVTDAIARSANATAKVAAERERVLLEQSDTLVWLLGGQSLTLKSPWRALSPTTAAVCAAIEVQDLSRFVLGRPDAAALLSQAVEAAGKPSNTTTSLDQLQTVLTKRTDGVRAEVVDFTPLAAQIESGVELANEALEVAVRLHDEIGLLDALSHARANA